MRIRIDVVTSNRAFPKNVEKRVVWSPWTWGRFPQWMTSTEYGSLLTDTVHCPLRSLAFLWLAVPPSLQLTVSPSGGCCCCAAKCDGRPGLLGGPGGRRRGPTTQKSGNLKEIQEKQKELASPSTPQSRPTKMDAGQGMSLRHRRMAFEIWLTWE
jgi:hypothetical protein